jgi:C4-dicarboxylate-specific signal transduction histidine kinase
MIIFAKTAAQQAQGLELQGATHSIFKSEMPICKDSEKGVWSMIDASEKINPLLATLLNQLGIGLDSNLSGQQTRDLLLKFNELLSHLELDRDLLEQSLKLASDEMQEHYVQMIQSSKMASLGEMAGSVAHEINNPLQVLSMTADLLNVRLAASNPDSKVVNALATIKTQVKRIASIVRGLKTISRDGSGDDFVATDLKMTVAETVSLCRGKMLKAQIEFQSPGNIPELQFFSRPSQISQVLINLLNNACDAIEMTEDLPQRSIELKIETDSDFIRFLVLDSGPGVPPELDEKIMRPFFTTKPIGKGTGLGLSVSSAIATDHGGTLRLDRSRNLNCFVFEISCVPPQMQKLKSA